jgi:hypothetical protein
MPSTGDNVVAIVNVVKLLFLLLRIVVINYIVLTPRADTRTLSALPEPIDMILIDVTWAPLEDVLPVVRKWLAPQVPPPP